MNILTELTMSGVLASVLAATGAQAGEIRHDWRDIHRTESRSAVRDHDWTAASGAPGYPRRLSRLRADRWDLRVTVATFARPGRSPQRLPRRPATERAARNDLQQTTPPPAPTVGDLPCDYGDIRRDQELAGDWRDYYHDGR
jgi:hypothetical protein